MSTLIFGYKAKRRLIIAGLTLSAIIGLGGLCNAGPTGQGKESRPSLDRTPSPSPSPSPSPKASPKKKTKQSDVTADESTEKRKPRKPESRPTETPISELQKTESRPITTPNRKLTDMVIHHNQGETSQGAESHPTTTPTPKKKPQPDE
jgi:hypothetical protein